MYDGNQVVRVVSKYKKHDAYNIGVEMSERKGTGNYDKERTQFNVEYVSLTEKNLYQEIKQTLKNRNIEFNDKPSTNMFNGITFSSGPEFFETLGMKFVDSGRTYHEGKKKGQIVKIPEIKSKEDIPKTVSYYFDSCMDFLKEYVGEENILLAQIHYDEDTPHLQVYFLPIVNTVKRKQYVKDKDGNVVKEKHVNANGNISYTPKLLRGEKGKIIYSEVKGKFLNCDEFWKQRGGQYSFGKLQDEFNDFITKRGFNLYRGDIGSKVENQTKTEWQIKELNAELEELKQEKANVLKVIENSKKGLEISNESNDKDNLLNPTKRKLGGYKENDVNKIIDYTKDLKKQVIVLNTDNQNKDIEINKLLKENDTFKNNKELIKRNEIIKEQKSTIKEQTQEISRLNGVIDILNSQIENLQAKLDKFKEKIYNFCDKICRALAHKIGLHYDKDDDINYYEMESYAYDINRKYDKEKDKSDDFEIGM